MSTTVVNPDPSTADLRAMLVEPAAPAEKPAEVAVEPVAEAANPEAAAPADVVTTEPEEEPLPEGVQKRIAKEAEKAARIQSEIDRAVSTRKAKEAELAKLASTTGSEPAPNTEQANAKPIKPTFGKENPNETWEQYEQALSTYETKRDAWLVAEADRKAEEKFATREQKNAAKARMDEAVKVHGEDFPDLIEKAYKDAPPGLGQAISALDNWSGVAKHLASNPARLAEVTAKFNANPVAAIAELGRIEAALKAPNKAAAEPLPAPPAKVGGGASATAGAFDYENASPGALRKQIAKIRAG